MGLLTSSEPLTNRSLDHAISGHDHLVVTAEGKHVYKTDQSASVAFPKATQPAKQVRRVEAVLAGDDQSHSHDFFESVREGDQVQSFVTSPSSASDAMAASILPSPLYNDAQYLHAQKTDAVLDPCGKTFDVTVASIEVDPEAGDDDNVANHAINRLPYEVLDKILRHLLLDIPPAQGFSPRNADLVACAQTCRALHWATLGVLYRHITIPHSRIFAKMLRVVTNNPHLGNFVRRLDFSHYSVIGLGRTRRANTEIQNLTSATLRQCFELMPSLQEFLVHEHLDDLLDVDTLRSLFSLKSLQAVDFCACSSNTFANAFTSVVETRLPDLRYFSNIRRLSLHECSTLPATVFEKLIKHLTRLTHLEVAHTAITDKALAHIPGTARLTHLNVSRCTRLSGDFVVAFLLEHPAVKNLQYLNLMSDRARHQLLSSDHLHKLLPQLPTSLRSLNLNGSALNTTHVSYLRHLKYQLDELAISHANLSIEDVRLLFGPSQDGQVSKIPSTLKYVDLTSVSSLTRSTLFLPSTFLLMPSSRPLSVIEVSDEGLMAGLRSRYSIPGNGTGWIIRESGRRSWFVRDEDDGEGVDGCDDGVMAVFRRGSSGSRCSNGSDESEDDGIDEFREWKWGARWWGMRKVPVSWMRVGGMFGHYMFKA